jgi:hypothetical protein
MGYKISAWEFGKQPLEQLEIAAKSNKWLAIDSVKPHPMMLAMMTMTMMMMRRRRIVMGIVMRIVMRMKCVGNELSGSGIGTRVMPEQYAADVMALRKIVEEVYNEEGDAVPLLVAPDGFFDEAWTERFLESAAAGFFVPPIDVLSHHIYNLGAGAWKTLFSALNPKP